jgi:hypothetical protein
LSFLSKIYLAAVRSFPLLPKERRKRIERNLRGRREMKLLRSTDCICISYGKSGRTWVRLMLVRYYQLRYRVRLDPHMHWIRLRRRAPQVPRLRFSHDNYVKDSSASGDSKEFFGAKKVALLVRHPADVSVSMFFQWKNRMKPTKRWVNDYPADTAAVSLFDFVIDPRWGIPRVIEFLNGWSANWHKVDDFLMFRYEDLRADTQGGLAHLLRFLDGAEPDGACVAEAVAHASFDNLRKVEEGSARKFWVSYRLRPKDTANPDSYKVRRGKVGGYRDYFDDAQVSQIERLIDGSLDPAFGYSSGRPTAEMPSVERAS